MAEKNTWIIGQCNSESDWIDMWRVRGSADEVKELMLELIKGHEEELGKCDGKPETIEEIETIGGNMLSACPYWSDCHITITAWIQSEPADLARKGETK